MADTCLPARPGLSILGAEGAKGWRQGWRRKIRGRDRRGPDQKGPRRDAHRILRSRYFDEKAVELVDEREIPDVMNTAIGQGAVGAWMVLREDDYIMGNYGWHGHPSGKGAT